MVGRVLRRPWASHARHWVLQSIPKHFQKFAGLDWLPPESPALEALATRDLWFYEQFIMAPRIVARSTVY